MVQITSPMIKSWEKVWRIDDGEAKTVRYRVFNRGTWHDQRVTRDMEESYSVDELLMFILPGAREGAHRLKAAGPSGQLP